MASLWNALQNYTSLSLKDSQEVIIEKVEPSSQVNPTLSFLVGIVPKQFPRAEYFD